MDYTTNYHLPQWVEDDRIRRTDFNDAMASIESGLTQGETDRAALRGSLSRLAYNCWHQMAASAEVPWQEGGFRQGFAKGEISSAGGMCQLRDRAWTANGDKLLNFEEITVKKLSSISFETGSDTCSFTFAMPAAGYIQAFLMIGRYDGNVGQHNNGSAAIRIYNDETDMLLEELPTFIGTSGFMGDSGSGTFKVNLERTFHTKTRYRIELQINRLDIPCSFELGADVGPFFVMTGRKQETVTFTRQLLLEEASQGGSVLVHYDTWGGTGAPSVSWQGETIAPYKIRDIAYRGKNVKEAEFRINRAIPTDSTFTLTIHCEKDGEFSLYDWGAALI